MADEFDLKEARTVYKSLCKTLEKNDWHYQADEERLVITCGAQGDDLPMEISIEVDKDRKLVILMSFMPFKVSENRRDALAVAVSKANYGMVDGSFDYDYNTGKIVFRMTSSFRESLLGEGLFMYMLECSCHTIDEYNDKFLMVAKNDMTAEEILKFIK